MNRTLTYEEVKTPEDIRRAAALAQEIWHECYREMLSPAQIEFMLEKFQSEPAIAAQMRDEGMRYFILSADGETVGYYAAKPMDDGLFLSKLYLRAAARGHGYASAVIARLKEQAAAQGFSALRLVVCRQNPSAYAAYLKLGFTVTMEKKTHIGNGFYMDDYFMKMELPNA